MSASEEQEQELEVLESIYPDELTKISDTEFTILLSLEEPDVDTEAEGYEAPSILLRVTYTPNYPNEAPTLALSLPSYSSPHPLTFPDDEKPLHAALDTAVEENLGMAMIFTLATTLKEAAEDIIRGRAEEAQKAREEAARIEEEKEMEKFRGELVTKEVFEKWREAFMKEMREKKEAEEKEREEAEMKGGKKSGNASGLGPGGRKLTGKELFERGLVGGNDEDGEPEDEDTPDVGKLEIKA
ncbi:hypothetical protein ABW19_dt0206121 [Dactylella cylindrospora]|nr:hypothetical protein ABW19_dt0206121 [Dactylella cylindrospora]